VPIAVLVLAGALIVYVLFGYPVLLGFLAGRSERPVHKARLRKRVSIILAVRDGERWIARKLETLAALDYPQELIEILVVSDGSTDGTPSIVEATAKPNVRLFRLPPGGKAIALNHAIRHATGEILFFTDVRQTLEPSSLQNLVDCFADPQVGVASGELTIVEGETLTEVNIGLYWKYEKLIRKRLSRIDSVLGATGCIYAMRRELAVELPAGTLLDDVHLPLSAFFRGYRVILDDTAKAFDFPTSLNAEFRRKVRTQAGMYQIMRSFPALLGPRNRMWIHFVSHKLGRLLLPAALLVALGASVLLPWPYSIVAVGAQAAFYGLAALDTVLPESSPIKRLSSPIRTFVVLMAAAFCAPSILFLPENLFWSRTEVRQTKTT
jgi:biofilm PGA synthesis N-glycosyltransferase PgaC